MNPRCSRSYSVFAPLRLCVKSIPFILLTIIPLHAADKNIDAQHSAISIHVGKAGIFSGAGHEHWVNAPIASGIFNDGENPRVEFTVQAAKLEVRPDPKVNKKDQAEIQKSMQEKVLESAKYPEITFRSSAIEKLSEEAWTLSGRLTLHGVTKPVTLSVKREAGAYSGAALIRQTDFGIRPIAVAGGAIKVRNELDITFRIVSQ